MDLQCSESNIGLIGTNSSVKANHVSRSMTYSLLWQHWMMLSSCGFLKMPKAIGKIQWYWSSVMHRRSEVVVDDGIALVFVFFLRSFGSILLSFKSNPTPKKL